MYGEVKVDAIAITKPLLRGRIDERSAHLRRAGGGRDANEGARNDRLVGRHGGGGHGHKDRLWHCNLVVGEEGDPNVELNARDALRVYWVPPAPHNRIPTKLLSADRLETAEELERRAGVDANVVLEGVGREMDFKYEADCTILRELELRNVDKACAFEGGTSRRRHNRQRVRKPQIRVGS